MSAVDTSKRPDMKGNVRIFVSFDLEHDEDLFDLLLEQSALPSFGFEISGRSDARPIKDFCDEKLRSRIREADEVIVICGEHTEGATAVSAELLVAQEEKTPYFLLWGRPDHMCTKPIGAKRDEGIYKWTPEILQDQITLTLRNSRWDSKAPSGPDATPTS